MRLRLLFAQESLPLKHEMLPPQQVVPV